MIKIRLIWATATSVVAALAIAAGVVVATHAAPATEPAAPVMVVTQTVRALPDGFENWHQVSPALAETLREWGDADDRAARDWERCWELIGDTTTIICPDGHVENS